MLDNYLSPTIFYPEHYWPNSSYSYWPIVTTVWVGNRPRILHAYEKSRTLDVLSKDRILIVYEEDARTDTVVI